MEKTNKIITIDGKLMRVAYTGAANHCNRCCIKGARCRVRLEPCKKYNDPNSPLNAIFVPAEDGEADTAAQVRHVPADVQEAADNYEKSLDYYHYTNDEPRIAYAAGMLAERERLMSGALCGNVDMCGVSAWVELPTKVLTDYLRSNFKEGDEVRVIIVKKEDEK